MHSFTLATLGFLGLQLNAVSAFHVAVPVQSANMRTSKSESALRATEGTSERRGREKRELAVGTRLLLMKSEIVHAHGTSH